MKRCAPFAALLQGAFAVLRYDNTRHRVAVAQLCSTPEFSSSVVDVSTACPATIKKQLESCGVACNVDALTRQSDRSRALYDFQEEAGERVELLSTGEKDKTYLRVDLRRIPEKYTGYSGAVVWKHMYSVVEGDRVLTKMLSGVHCSVTIHLCAFFNDDPAFRPLYTNHALMRQRVCPEHIENLRYLLDCLLALVPLCFEEMKEIGAGRVHRAALSTLEAEAGKIAFAYGEYALQPGALKKAKVLSSLVSCVECMRCRVWGKVQLEGLLCAVKLLLRARGLPLEIGGAPQPLSHAELKCFVNLTNQISTSIAQYNKSVAEAQHLFERQKQQRAGREAALNASFLVGAGGLLAAPALRKKCASCGNTRAE